MDSKENTQAYTDVDFDDLEKVEATTEERTEE